MDPIFDRNKSLIEVYFDLCEKYEKIYEKCVVLMEVGSFFEAYGIDNDIEKIGHAKLIGEILNIAVTRRSKAIAVNNRKNPLMAGITSIALEKYVKVLIENGYTVVLVEQVTPPPHPKREVTQILSPGTYLNNSMVDQNNIISIYIEQVNCKQVPSYCIGLSLIDLTTGKNSIQEVYDKKEDKNYALDEAIRYILANTPNEIIINTKDVDMNKEQLISRLHLYTNKLIHIRINSINPEYYKISYQQKFLKTVFDYDSLLNPIEHFNLERMNYARISYLLLLNYAYQHNENILRNIEYPIITEDDKYLHLDTTTINQLNVVNPKDNFYRTNKRYGSLFEVINHTSNVMGRRLLKYRLLNPIIDVNILNTRYDLITEMMLDNKYTEYEKYLKIVNDLERLHRKISLGLLHPYEIDGLLDSYEIIKDLINIVKLNKNFKIFFNDYNENDIIDKLNIYISQYLLSFNIDKFQKYHRIQCL